MWVEEEEQFLHHMHGNLKIGYLLIEIKLNCICDQSNKCWHCTWLLNNFHHSFVLYVDGAFNIYSIQDWLPNLIPKTLILDTILYIVSIYVSIYYIYMYCTLLFLSFKSNEIDRDKINQPHFVSTHLQIKKSFLFFLCLIFILFYSIHVYIIIQNMLYIVYMKIYEKIKK